jgi:putative PEP-CTERM system histidine kinase
MPAVSRWGLKPLCLALAAGYIFELYLFADALLFSRIDADVWAARGIAHALLIPLIAIAGTRSPSWTLRMSVSREMVFHSTALAGAGLYLLVIAGAAYYVRYFGGDWGRALQMALLFAGLVLLGALLFSGAVRARLRVFISKHLFPYRYDYRAEWLRFTQALSSADRSLDLGQSVIKALSDLVESPWGSAVAGRCYGKCKPHSRFNHPDRVVESLDSPLCGFCRERLGDQSRGVPRAARTLRGARAARSGCRGSTTPGW